MFKKFLITILRSPEGDAGASSGGDSQTATISTTMGDAAAQSQQSSSAAAAVPSIGGQAAGQTAPTADFKTSLGDYAKEPMFEPFKDVAALAKAYKDTKALVGQKLGIPDENASPEAKAAFYKALGVPETSEGYELDKLGDDVPAEVKALFDADHAKKWADKFKELNIPASVAKELQKAQIAELSEGMNGYQQDKSKTDADFDAVADKAFGADKKEEALQSARADIERYGSKEIREMVLELPNAALALIAQVVNGVRAELGGEDQTIDGGAGGSAQSEADMRAEMRAIMATPEYSNPFVKGREAHNEASRRVTELSNKIAKAQQSQPKR